MTDGDRNGREQPYRREPGQERGTKFDQQMMLLRMPQLMGKHRVELICLKVAQQPVV